jgi:hypothetical protein
MFIHLTAAQATGIHRWGSMLKTTLTWRDVEDREDITFDLLLSMSINPRDMQRMQPDVRLWVQHAHCTPAHAKAMLAWPANPISDLGGDLADVIAMRATSKQLKTMGVTYRQLMDVGMTPDTMRLIGLNFQGWIDLGLTLDDVARGFTDAQLSRVFQLTRTAVMASFRGGGGGGGATPATAMDASLLG